MHVGDIKVQDKNGCCPGLKDGLCVAYSCDLK